MDARQFNEGVAALEATKLESRKWQQVHAQAALYMNAVYGENWIYKAPETFDNVLVRWIWAIAQSRLDFAGDQMAIIQQMAKEARRAE
jgi:hypothetical protein